MAHDELLSVEILSTSPQLYGKIAFEGLQYVNDLELTLSDLQALQVTQGHRK